MIYRREVKPKPYLLKQFEKEIVAVIKAIKPYLPEEKLTICNCELFLSHLSKTCFLNRELAVDFLNRYMPIALDGLGLVRLAVGIIEVLPLYKKLSNNFKVFPSYDGTPSVQAHCKILHSFAYKAPEGKIRVAMIILVMTSHKAGQTVTYDVSYQKALKLMSDVRIERRKNKVQHPPNPTELTGIYCTVLFGNQNNCVDVPLSFMTSTDENKHNKALMFKRVNRKCDKALSCSVCSYGTDKCAIACRYKTKQQEESK